MRWHGRCLVRLRRLFFSSVGRAAETLFTQETHKWRYQKRVAIYESYRLRRTLYQKHVAIYELYRL